MEIVNGMTVYAHARSMSGTIRESSVEYRVIDATDKYKICLERVDNGSQCIERFTVLAPEPFPTDNPDDQYDWYREGWASTFRAQAQREKDWYLSPTGAKIRY